ncbi:MAG: sigma-54 dependent transcriptional regulator [Bacteroidota bacterium]
MKSTKIFVVEDDVIYAKLLEHKLKQDPTNQVEIYTNGSDLLNNLYKKPALITLDYKLPDIPGEEVLESVLKNYPDIPIIVISGQEDIKTAVSLLKEGAYDYVVKDDEAIERIENLIVNIKEKLALSQEVDLLRSQIIDKYGFDNLVGKSSVMQKVYHTMTKVVGTNINVSLHGEVGTGKGLIAKTIHYNSLRKEAPFITVDLRAIKPENIDADLFGLDKSMTADGAMKLGDLERANGGTIFFEGFEDIDEQLQFYIQKILQNKEIVRVGGVESIPIDIRVIMSYNGTLSDLVVKGKIREQQYYRTMGVPIEIPSLRERESDIILLAKKFMDGFVKSNQMETKILTKDAQTKLLNYPYTGNVQELKAIVELATVMSSENIIMDEDISFNSSNNLTEFLFEEKTLKDYTRGIIKHFLEKYDNNVLLVADKLDVGKSTIYRMIKNNEI